jgi:hypothetical protein
MAKDWISKVAKTGLLATTALEGAAALQRFDDRKQTFAEASRQAAELGRTLVVVGAPRAGAHTRLIGAYGCGDVCVDLGGLRILRAQLVVDAESPAVLPRTQAVVNARLRRRLRRHWHRDRRDDNLGRVARDTRLLGAQPVVDAAHWLPCVLFQ